MRNYTFGKISLLIISWILISCIIVSIAGRPAEKFEKKLYQKISGKAPQHFQFDSAGIPMVVFEGKLGKQYSVVSVSEQVLRWTDGKDTLTKGNINNCLKWLISSGVALNDSSVIYYDNYDWPSYKMKAPWRSAMNQGRTIQAFTKAYQKTGDSLYLDYARRSMNTLFTKVEEGGVSYIDSSGYWYEEYADDNVPQSRVLNGMIVVLQALSDFYKVTNDSNARFLFRKGVESVKHDIHLYDNNGHSDYDILGKPASAWYHKFHTEQLEFLYNETGEKVFNEYRLKWEQFREPSYIKTLYRKPTNIGIFTVFSIFMAVFTVLFVLSYFLWFRKRKVEELKG